MARYGRDVCKFYILNINIECVQTKVLDWVVFVNIYRERR